MASREVTGGSDVRARAHTKKYRYVSPAKSLENLLAISLLSGLEEAAQAMWNDGRCAQWLKSADAGVARVSATVNGVMIEELCRSIGYSDAACAELFRVGADLYGWLALAGIGLEKHGEVSGDIAELWEHKVRSNTFLIKQLKQDQHHEELHRLTETDASLGRMTPPRLASETDLSYVRLVPRFGVEQGLREDGTVKSRAIDNMSWCVAPEEAKQFLSKKKQKELSINGCTVVPV